jgi:RNA polymerase sigma-70 factor (ECF subfamily)
MCPNMRMHRDRDLCWNLLEPEHARIQAFCRRLAGNRDDGDDLCQEALARAWERFVALRDQKSFKAWLYRIAVNCFKNTRRRAALWRLVGGGNGSAPEPALPDPRGAIEARRLLERAFATIPPEDRALVILFELEGWTMTELAAMTGRTPSGMKVRLFRIRRRMREALERYLARCDRKTRIEATLNEEDLCIAAKPNVD